MRIAERLDPREPSLSFNMNHKFSSSNNSFKLKVTAASTIKMAYDYLKVSYQKLTSTNSSIQTASMIPVKQRVPAASVEVSQLKDNQFGMTSEAQHPVGHAASEMSTSLSTTSIKVSQPYPANSALVSSSVSEVPDILQVTSRASVTSTLVPCSVSEVPASMVVTSRALSQCIHHQQHQQQQRRRRRRRR